MKKLMFTIFLFCSITSILFAQKTQNVNIAKYKYYAPNGVELIQTKSGLTIELIPLAPNLQRKFPELFSWNIEDMPKAMRVNLSSFYIKQPDGKYYTYTFGAEQFLNVYKIKITNNTGHIIKMSDARILMRVEGEDPIKPVTKVGDPTLYEVGESKVLLPKSAIEKDESLVQWITWLYSEWDKNRKKGFLSFEYPIGFPSQVIAINRKAYKLINDLNVEILPEDSYSGLLLFPRLIIDNEISLKMYEFITKTDAAGNTVEKSNFDFKLKLTDGTRWFDQNNKIWIDGEPSDKVEYYDKTQKKWILGTPPKK